MAYKDPHQISSPSGGRGMKRRGYAYVLHRKLFLFVLGSGLFFLFIFFSYLVHKNLFVNIDFNTTVRLQDHVPRRLDSIFSFLSDIGKFEVIIIVLLVILAIYRKVKTFLVVGFFGFMHVLEIYGKTFVSHKPPPHFLLRTHDIFTFPQFYVSTENSYPSGHAGRAFFLTAFLGVMVGNTKKLSRTKKIIILSIMGSYDIVMGISRIYLGEHWTSDVIGGAILGMSFGVFGSIFL